MWTRRICSFFLVAAVVIFFASCQKEGDDSDGEENEDDIMIAFQFIGSGGSVQGLDHIRVVAYVESEEGDEEEVVVLEEGFEGKGDNGDDDDDLEQSNAEDDDGDPPPSFPPLGWKLESRSDPPYTWFVGGINLYISAVYQGDWIAEVYGSIYFQNEVLITPALDIEEYQEVILTYYTAGSVDLSERQTLVVNITTDGGRRWAEIDRFSRENDQGNYEWNEHEVDITDPASFFEELE